MTLYLGIFCFFYNNLVVASHQSEIQNVGHVYYDNADMPFDKNKVHFSFDSSSVERIASYYKLKYKIDVSFKDINLLSFHNDQNFLSQILQSIENNFYLYNYKQAYIFKEQFGDGYHATIFLYLKHADKEFLLYSDSLGARSQQMFFCHNFFNQRNIYFFVIDDSRQVGAKGCFIDALFWIKTLMHWSEDLLINFFINNST